MSPEIIVQGRQNIGFSKRKIAFGAYTFVYYSTTNIMKSRIVPVIDLRELNNSGEYHFMSLLSGQQRYIYIREEPPIDYDVIC